MEFLEPQLFSSQVMHERLFPRRNYFQYPMDYYLFPLDWISQGKLNSILPLNKRGVISFQEKDYGQKEGFLEPWIDALLKKEGLQSQVEKIYLLCLPRIYGYVFNPVCFWFCYNSCGKMIAVLSEVNNTFGEAHQYLCYHFSQKEIDSEEWMVARKDFHVSPFLVREGVYKFKFHMSTTQLRVWIHYFNEDGRLQLKTSMIGSLKPLERRHILVRFYKTPWLFFKVISLIHWQALKLWLKGMRYLQKPQQKQVRLTRNIDKKDGKV